MGRARARLSSLSLGICANTAGKPWRSRCTHRATPPKPSRRRRRWKPVLRRSHHQTPLIHPGPSSSSHRYARSAVSFNRAPLFFTSHCRNILLLLRCMCCRTPPPSWNAASWRRHHGLGRCRLRPLVAVHCAHICPCCLCCLHGLADFLFADLFLCAHTAGSRAAFSLPLLTLVHTTSDMDSRRRSRRPRGCTSRLSPANVWPARVRHIRAPTHSKPKKSSACATAGIRGLRVRCNTVLILTMV